jgi:hypothetical protein
VTLRAPARALGRLGLLGLVGLAAGCLGGSTPEPRYFTLSSPAGASPAPLAERPELGLVLGQVDLPRYLDRAELVTRSGAHGLRVWNGVRWGGSLRTDVQRVVADQLARLLGTSRVAVYPAEARFPVSYRVLLELLELGSAPGHPVALRARWTIAGADGRAVAVGATVLEQPPASASWEDYVAAHGVVLAALTQEIAARIAALPEGGRVDSAPLRPTSSQEDRP